MSAVGRVTGSTYHIAKGDTLSEIAQRFRTNFEELAAANGINNPNLIYAGATLQLGTGAGTGQAAGGSAGTSTGTVAPAAASGSASWMNTAYSYVGQHEYARGDNPVIVSFLASTSLGPANDETAWCSAFVNFVMKQAGYKGTNSAGADSWMHWGAGVGSLSNARTGDIVVLHDSAGREHVGFLVRSGNGTVTLLGGNQSNQVKESVYSLSSHQIMAIRRPASSV
jgi:uncharacterized protein (TIGR02594 family)